MPTLGVNVATPREEQLAIPDGIVYQLVYRREVHTEEDGAERPAGFFLWSSPVSLLANLLRVAICTGWPNALKGLLRLAWGRLFYGVMDAGVIVSWGWLTIGYCRHYWVESNAVVFGPMITSPDYRRRGHATRALRAAMAEMAKRGYGIFYIDTDGANSVARRVIEKCGFGQPTASFVRGILGHLRPL